MITGGLGGLGLSTAALILSEGHAQNIVLLSRSGRVARGDQQLEKILNGLLSSHTERLQVSTADSARCVDLMNVRQALGPSSATIHMASSGLTAATQKLTLETLRSDLSAKALGAYALHTVACRSLTEPTLYISSVSSFGGLDGVYSAANSFLHALAAADSKRGVTTRSMMLSPVRDLGMAAAIHGDRLEAGASPLGDLAVDATNVARRLVLLLARPPRTATLLFLPKAVDDVVVGMSLLIPHNSTLLSQMNQAAPQAASTDSNPDTAAFALEIRAILQKVTKKSLTPSIRPFA